MIRYPTYRVSTSSQWPGYTTKKEEKKPTRSVTEILPLVFRRQKGPRMQEKVRNQPYSVQIQSKLRSS